MTPVVDENRGQQALEMLSDLARESVQMPSAARLDRGLEELSARIAAERFRGRAWLRWSLAGATAVAAIALIVTSVRPPHAVSPAPLSYRVQGGSVEEGGYLRESGGSGIKVSFSEGTELALMPGTRGRLRAVDDAGARIAIEQGTAAFQVKPRTHARWRVDVGPFLVTVTGTVFTVSWDAVRERFELRLRHGRVVVSGPISGGDIALRSGQRLVVDLPKAETLISEHEPEAAWSESSPAAPAFPPPAAEPPHVRPSPATPADKAHARSAAPPVAKADPDRRWAEAVAAGHLDEILTAVARAGVKETLDKASSEDLFSLATAARYRRRVDLARDALLAERRRFPSSDRALDAAFLLGRVEEMAERRTERALAWYDEYLKRAPTGTYAAEALGRKMIVTSKLEGSVRAQPLAEEYLRRFPSGSYAGSARALLRAAP